LGARGGSVYVLADGNVWKVASDGSERNLTEGQGTPLVPAFYRTERFGVRPDLARDYAVLQTMGAPGASRTLVVVDFATDQVKRLALPASYGELAAYVPQGDVVLFRDSDLRGKDSTDHSTSLYEMRGATPPQRLVQVNVHYKEITFGKQEQITYTYGGRPLAACAVLPPDFNPKKRYPVIVEIYPGVGLMSGGVASCALDSVAFFNPSNPQLFAAKGYIYLFPATPPDLIKSDKGPIDKIGDVVLAAVDALIAKGYADPNRLGVFGESQGGFAVPWVVTRTNRFKAAVATHGAVDYASQYGQVPLLRNVLPEDYFSAGDAYRYEDTSSSFYLGAPPWKDPDAYVRNSAVFSAGRIETPLMMINSDFDTFPIDQYQEMFTALYRQRKDTQLVTYWGESHGVTSPANVRDEWARMYAWYDRYLKAK
jgi:dipeptidyl aminopeptidase/acylaminoacyl peptidase